MANIRKTVLFPVPTEWLGQEQDPEEAGMVVYNGPRYLTTRWRTDLGFPECEVVMGPDDSALQTPTPVNCVDIVLDAEEYPLHAAALWGWEDVAEQYEVECGPADEPNPTICDPYHFSEAFNLRSFYYDVETETWSQPEFSSDDPHSDDHCSECGDTVCFGWHWVRKTRDAMLAASDSRIAPDMSDAAKQPWLDYRQKLRDLPDAWAGVGTATHLIVWPLDPDQIAAGLQVGERP